jgi:type II secretory pathway component PulM
VTYYLIDISLVTFPLIWKFVFQNLTEAEAAFTKLLALKSYCEEAKNRIFSIRIKQLEEMGYHPNEAFTALTKSKNKTVSNNLFLANFA